MTSLFEAKIASRLASTAVISALIGLSGCVSAVGSETTPLWLGQTSTGAPTTSIGLTSWQDMKFVGLVRQGTDFSCGAAALSTIFNYALGYQTTERQVLVNMLKIADPDVVREKGFSLLDMKNYSQTVGLQAEGYRVDYAALEQLNLPSIALIDIKGYKHFVIIRKAFPDRIAIGDPALGNRTMSRSEFETAWNGVAFVVTGDSYDPANSLINPPSPLSARRLMEFHTNQPPVDLVEFGIGAGFSF